MAKKIKDEHGNVYVQKTPFYKKWWFIAIVAIGVIGSLLGDKSEKTTETPETSTAQVSTAESTASETTEEASTTEASEELEVEPVYTIG